MRMSSQRDNGGIMAGRAVKIHESLFNAFSARKKRLHTAAPDVVRNESLGADGTKAATEAL